MNLNINGIMIENETTFDHLTSLFSDKSPSKETVLLLRLYFDGHLTKKELELLNQRIINDVLQNEKKSLSKGISGIKNVNKKSMTHQEIKPLF